MRSVKLRIFTLLPLHSSTSNLRPLTLSNTCPTRRAENHESLDGGSEGPSSLLLAMEMTVLEREFDPEGPVIDAVRSGDRYAFAEFVRRQSRWIRGVIFGVLGDHEQVEDVLQQVLSSIWQRIGDLRDTRLWRPWVYRLARNAAVDAGRDLTRRRVRSQEHAADPTQRDATSPPDQGLVGREDHGVMLAAIAGLPALYRESFVLRHLSGWSYRQIGDLLGIQVETVETRLVRARRMLREALKDRVL